MRFYDGAGKCLYTTASALPADRSGDWGVLRAARQETDTVLRAEGGGLTGARTITTREGEVLGYVVFRMAGGNFDQLFAPGLRPSDDVLLVDPTWRMVYCTQSAHAQDTLSALRAQLLSGQPLTGGEEDCGYYVSSGAQTGLFLILQQPKTYTAQVVRSIYFVAGVMGLLCLGLCLVCAWWLSRHLSEPVGELDAAMGRVEKGDYDVRIRSARQDEMGRLAASFDRMTQEYQQNLARSVQRERELNETRLRMLQSQLNPHFLYNTLDCMKWLGVTHGVAQIATLATSTWPPCCGGDFRQRAHHPGGRAGADRSATWTSRRSASATDSCARSTWTSGSSTALIPKLVLQPLVENAIIHGVADSDEGFIKLWAEQQGERSAADGV